MKLFAANFILMLSLIAFPMVYLPAQTDITFRNITVENLYPKYVLFRVEICGRSSTSYVTFNYISHLSGTWEKTTKTLKEGETGYGCFKYKYFLETQKLFVPPFFQIEYFWSVTEGAKVVGQSSKDVYTYKNEGYTWKNLSDEHLIVWWHDRPDSFGQEVMSIATLAYNDQAKFYSFSLATPITIVITNTFDEFYAWQPQKNTMIIGKAFSRVSLTVQLVEDNANYHDLLYGIIPHEISHVYFEHLVKNDAGAPIWLNEGLAVYNEYSDHWDKWVTLRAAQERDEILTLKDLDNVFGKDSERLELAYAESYYAVLYMEEVYGKSSIATLLDEYSTGASATVALEKTFGKNSEGFEHDFIVWLDERLKTPPSDTNLLQPLSNNVVWLFTGILCVGVLFALGAGIIFIAVLLKFGSDRAKKTSETNAYK